MTTGSGSLSFETLSESLQKSVVRVLVGNTVGTGYVIAKDLVLTCRHVVAPLAVDGKVKLATRTAVLDGHVENVYPPMTELQESGVSRYPDLAILRIDDANEIPAVILDDNPVVFGEALTTFGWAADSQVPGQAKRLIVASPMDTTENGEVYVRVNQEAVVPGMSGSPVCNAEGLVCGYLRLTRGAQTTLGGWVVPFSAIISTGLAPDLAGPYNSPGPAASRWADMLTAARLRARGRGRNGELLERTVQPARVDIALAWTAREPLACWTVTALGHQDCSAEVTEAQLGAGVFDAVNHWSRRHTVPTRSDIEVLGRLLGRAILADPVNRLVVDAVATSRPLVRICMDGDNDLGDVPWEFAYSDNMPLSTREELVMSRFVSVPLDPNDPPAATERLEVLLMLVGPQRSHQPGLDHTLTAESMANSLGLGLDRYARLEVEILNEPSLGDVEDALRDKRWDVVHYIGPAGDGSNGLNFAYGYADEFGVREGINASDLSEVARLVRGGGARMLIVQQLVDAAAWTGWNPPSSAILRNSLGGRLQAIVMAQHRASRPHVTMFSDALYAALDRGDAAEFAVQHARRKLFQSPPENDYTAFGSVTVITGSAGNVRMLTAASRHQPARISQSPRPQASQPIAPEKLRYDAAERRRRVSPT